MANVDFYNNELKNLLTNPGSFTGTPGFQFALNTGLGSIQGQNSRMRGSGNVMAALTRFGTGLASQDYGNQVSRLGSLLGQEQNYDLGQGNLKLGNERLDWDKKYGQGVLDNTRTANEQNYGLGMYRAGNEFALGSEQNANTAQNNWMNYLLGHEQNNNTASANQNSYNLNASRIPIDWFNAQTSRGAAQSGDYFKWLDYLKNGGGAY